MFTKEQIWDSIASDLRILKHLATKIPAGKENYKPTPKQRTTLELLQYLSVSGIGSMRAILEETPKVFGEYTERSKQTTVENFAQMLEKQEAEMKECFAKFTDEELNKKIDLWGAGEETKSNLFLNMVVKTIPAYKMQLFLYIKASGNESINTSNVWMGKDSDGNM
jgi:hypothetical protein